MSLDPDKIEWNTSLTTATEARWYRLPQWMVRAWRFKAHVLIFTTVILLLLVTLGGFLFHQRQLSKLSNKFLRLQVFGPSQIFTGLPENLDAFPSVFHVETRSPYGNATPQTQIELSLSTLRGVLLCSLREKTDHRGLLDMELPILPNLPKYVRLEVRAEHGANSDRFTALLTTVSQTLSEAPPQISLEETSIRKIQEGVKTLDSGRRPSRSRVEMTLKNRVSANEEPLEVRVVSREPHTPVFLGVWRAGRLIVGRPVAADTVAKTMTLTFSEPSWGLALVGLLDYGFSPPRMVQAELIYRMPISPSKTEETTWQDDPVDAAWRAEVLEKGRSGAFSVPECRVEYLCSEVSWDASQPTAEQTQQQERERYDAFRPVLESLLCPSSSAWGTAEETQLPALEMRPLAYGLTQWLEADRPGADGDAKRLELVDEMLGRQSFWLNERLGAGTDAKIHKITERNAPIVYDGMQTLNAEYQAELNHFCDEVRQSLAGLASVILCVALCLVLMVAMMGLLRIPTGFWIWMATLSVVVVACFLSMMIANPANFGKDSQGAVFQSYYGKADTR